MINKRKKKFQFAGQLHNIVPEFKPWGYSTAYAKKDTATLSAAAQNLQNIYEDRLKSKNEYLKAINDLDLGPYYGEYKKQKIEELQGQLNKTLADSNNDITSDVFAKGMIDIVGKTMADPKLATAKWNYQKMKDYQTQRDELSKEGKYNPMFDPNAQMLEKIKKGEDLWSPWDYKSIIPYHDYNAKLNEIAKGVTPDQDIVIESIGDYDSWVTKIKTVKEQKVYDYILAQKEGFFAGPEGTTFQIVTAKNYNANLPAGASPVKFDENGYPIMDAGFIKYRDMEFTKLILGISKGVGYTSKEDAAIQTAAGAVRIKEAELSAESAKAAAAAAEAEKAKQNAEVGLFNDNSAIAQTMEYQTPGIATSFDYESNYTANYKSYDAVYNKYKQEYSSYTFKAADGKPLTHDELLTKYITEGIDKLSISNNGAIISDEDRIKLDKTLSEVTYQKNLVKASAESINANDRQIVEEMKKITDANGKAMFSLINKPVTVNLNNGKSVSYKKIIDSNNNELWLVTDGDKGYVDKIVTPAEFVDMYKTTPQGTSPNATQAIYDFEKQVESGIVEHQQKWITDKFKEEIQDQGGKITEDMIQAYRQSDEYKKELNRIKKDAISKNSGEVYQNYYAARANLALANADPVKRKENYNALPADLRESKDAKTERMRTLVTTAEKDRNAHTYIELDAKSKDGATRTKTWEELKAENAKIITSDGWLWDDTETLDLQLIIDGYDVNNTIGGNWVGKIGFKLSDLKARFGEGKDNDPKWSQVQTKLNSLISEGTLEKIGDNYVFKNKQYMIPSHQVTEEYFRNTLSSDVNIMKQGIDNYNTAISKFNSGESVVVFPGANNTVVTLAQTEDENGSLKYALTYSDMMNVKRTEIFDDLSEASNSIVNYNQVVSQSLGQLRQHPNVKFNSPQSFNAKTNTVASNIVSKVVQGYVGSKLNTKEYRKDTNPDKDKLILGSDNTGNQIKIDTKSNTYGAKSVINILRQIAYVNSVDEYGNPVYDQSYSNLSLQDRTDLSDNNNMNKPIDMNNTAQLNMIRSVFGTDNIQISYPDNGNPNEIIITVKP